MPVKPKSTPVTGSDGSPAPSDSLTSVTLPSRVRWFKMRMTDDDRAGLEKLAAVHGLTLTDFVRSRLGLAPRYRKPPGTRVKVPKVPKPAPPAAESVVHDTLTDEQADQIIAGATPSELSDALWKMTQKHNHAEPAPAPEPVLSLAALMPR